MSLGLEVLNRIDVGNDPVNWIDPWGLEVYNTGDYNFGRDGSWIEPGDPTSRFFEDNIAHMGQTADIHDPLVTSLTNLGIPDILANYPTMIPSYGAACIYNNFTDPDESRPYFLLFEVRW